jgi:hypothetical protein
MKKAKNALNISPRYIVDETGKKTEVILDVATFEQLLEYLEDVYYSAIAKDAMAKGEFLDFEEVSKEILKK